MKFIVALLFISTAIAESPAKWKLTPVIKEGIRHPVHITTAPNEPDNLYIVGQSGIIWRTRKGVLDKEPWFKVPKAVVSGGEMGLLCLAFHPQYAKNKKFYVNYTAHRPELSTIVAEYEYPKTHEKVLLQIEQPYTNHNGGQLLFDEKGFLLIAMGDGGSANDPHGNGQNKKSLLGKILRVDVDKSDPTGKTPYAIPADNPFAKTGGRPEIFAWGMRNPWRVTRDRVNNVLYTGDVGQDRFEEIHRIELGKNYGWNIMEGNHCFRPETGCDKIGLEPAIWEYGRKEGISITGGFVYRGKKIKDLYGKYVYGDYGSGKIWALTYDPTTRKTSENSLLIHSKLPISSFGEDYEGEILVVSHEGAVYRLENK